LLSPRRTIGALLVALCLGNLVVTLSRSLIPLGVDGVVSSLEVRHEKHPGLDDVHLLWMGNRARQIDAEIATSLRSGDRIHKKAWARSLQTPRGALPLAPSRDFKGMLMVMPLLILLAGWVLRIPSKNSP
jgi:hypothetical protein